ncbi:ribonuclease H-like domain-containing protein [Aspergillus granulosus]|uniref:ribonuclease H n=1 Tax=Aspergillus granulosus TaxID=176169 RepID=A0ABR4H1P0_9EURO
MVYTIEIYVDGGCRGNGQPGSIGAAAAAIKNRHGKYHGWSKALPSSPTPTNQRAEITSIILGLEKALERYDELYLDPRLAVTIYSDSRYAVNCMNKWVYKWTRNGWTNSEGNEVANRDLIEEASDLDDQLNEKGDVQYIWIPREENQYADRLCNDCLDAMCDDRQSFSSDSSW